MHYLDYNEQILHQTGNMPLAYYYVDANHPRYHMRVHWHRETELIRVKQGRLRLYLDDFPVQAGAGDLILVGEGTMHGGDAEDGIYECIVFDPYRLLMHIEPCKEAMMPLLGKTLHLTAGEGSGDLSAAAQRLYAEAARRSAAFPLTVVGALFQVMGLLSPFLDKALPERHSGQSSKTELLKPALEYIETNYDSHITLEALARLSGLSPKYFCRCFRAVTHRSPIDYLNHYRIECASFLLTTSEMSVAEVAQKCGFSDSSFFIRQFRHYKNTTPHRYRSDRYR